MSHETQIVLDLPDEVAELLEADPPPHMEIRWDPLPDGAPVPPPCGETARFCVAGHEFFAKLMSLPTVVESKKSVDPAGEVYYESRKIGQVLVVAKSREELPAGTEQRDGLTPPMAAIRERKWRRRPLHDPKAVEQVALELERGLRGGGPLKPEYDMEMDELGRLQQQLREEQLKKLKAAEDIAALQAKAPPTNPLLRVRQQTQLDKLKRDEQKAEEECKRLQQLIDNGGIPLPTPAPGKKKKK
ncbi:hypothetical protein EMIHUDRAFT_210006 [Emiliania huxleyi CCMP1516]|uniref:TAFII55 protein conserved region domain-containing protein n=2 Tax=Emiliania huxleyi TaxID=2903 RepID=A0A0D3IMT4_EMIH1|nr:hypothetical protein EMIHUDRAFT_247348 [Emiliania huxleyi CCMP1516]XP_005769784.1 hypothetical protein EMIHUDRAFT_210006 [Emiliania huxleyi CCMP1516]EOD12569.1 hypothetical protein EMIHUDRAFT_247348 [Emiliania huxleyi CCMP1516]EOD17355.1 hypothetical protein EMIHUDRAFT_210006 [Emiliania huxleyi CCMP1516]|eukprot:XP_005764998.1 hypothetical protein EMIHUDRAFT_247348 [Emiliania huxleyi CCMP1516]